MSDSTTQNIESQLGDLYQITRVIADTASDAIITIDEQSTMLFVNRAAEKIFGYTRNELIGQSLTMLMPDYLRHVHRAGLKRYLATGTKHIAWEAVQLPGLRKDGSEVPLELSFGEFTEAGKRFFTGIARDVTDRKQAQEALQAREEYFRSLIENATDIITVLNRDGTRRYVSPSVERSLGYRAEELIGKNPFELIHPDDAGELQKLFAAGMTNPGFLVTKEYRIRNKDGSWRVHEATAHNLLDHPAVQAIVINSRDITERKRLERRLRAQYQAARILAEAESLAEAAPMLLQAIGESLGWELGQLWIVDREANILRWLAIWRISALKAPEFEEASLARTFAPGVGLPGRIWANRAADWISDIATDTNFPRGPFATKAGLRSAFAFPIMLGTDVSGVMEFFSRESQVPDQNLLDMTTTIGNQIGQFVERKHAEEERGRVFAREQRARHELETAIDRMARVQTVTDVALAHLSLDQLLVELLNRVRDAMTADTVAILLLESEGDELVAWAAKGLEEEVEANVRIPVGRGFAGQVAAQKGPVRIDDLDQATVLNPLLRQKGIRSLLGVPLLVQGRVIGVMHVGKFTRYRFTDDDTRLLQLVADRVALAIDNARLFEEERAARREAEAASRAKDEFLTTISHELRTPLTPVIGWIHMIRNGILPGKEAEHGLAVIEKNSQALKRLINDLLDMSAILTGKMRMEELPVSLGAVISEAAETVRPSAMARDIKLDVNFRGWQDETVTGDRARLLQVFWNLLSNAIKFSSPGGHVRVHCGANGRDVVVQVEDAGQGIAPDFLPFVFDRFRQADGSKTRSHGGLGLGLALVKSLVEAHQGQVEAESGGSGLGSRFTVRLPRNKAGKAAGGEVSGIEPQPGLVPARLVIVEDDPDTLEMLRATLDARGFTVSTCESAAEMLEAAPRKRVDLLISDIGMPEMDGLEMIKRLRRIPGFQKVPAIALTGYASKDDSDRALMAGFNAHVSKPVDPAELLKLVDRLLRKTSGSAS
jgi:PAS domain S-box-containing protein